MIAMMNPKNPKKLSVERVNGAEIGVEFTRSAALILPEDSVIVGVVGINSISSITKSEMIIINIPRLNIVHFQSFFLKIPGSRIHRMSPIAGNTNNIYLIHSGRLNSVRVTVQPRRIVVSTRSANTTRVIRIVLSDGFSAILARSFIIKCED